MILLSQGKSLVLTPDPVPPFQPNLILDSASFNSMDRTLEKFLTPQKPSLPKIYG